MATNRVTGMYSGLDTEGLITQLVEARKTKVTTAQKKQLSVKYKQDAWNDLNKKVKSLFNNISNLQYKGTYTKRTTNVSDSSIASVITADDAMISTQSLKVNKLAKAGYLTGAEMTTSDGEKATSATLVKDIVGVGEGGSLSIKVGNGAEKNITITDTMTLKDLTEQLSSVGVDAKFDASTQRLFIGSKSTGVENDFTISGDDALLSALGIGSNGTKIDAQDAEIELNGATFTSKSNTFNVNGLTITAKAESDKAVTLETTQDTSAIYDMIKKVIKQYSELVNEMDKYYNAKTDSTYQPLTDEEKGVMSEYEIKKWDEKVKEQALSKDSSISSLSSILQDVMGSGFEVNGKKMYLFDFGIETASYMSAPDNEKHALHIYGDADDSDSTFATGSNKLQQMISSDPDTVTDFFSQLSKSLYKAMDKASARIDGTRSYGSFFDDVRLKTEYSDYTTKISDLEKALTAYEDKWYSKFSKMETAMAKMQSNQNAVSGLLGM